VKLTATTTTTATMAIAISKIREVSYTGHSLTHTHTDAHVLISAV